MGALQSLFQSSTEEVKIADIISKRLNVVETQIGELQAQVNRVLALLEDAAQQQKEAAEQEKKTETEDLIDASQILDQLKDAVVNLLKDDAQRIYSGHEDIDQQQKETAEQKEKPKEEEKPEKTSQNAPSTNQRKSWIHSTSWAPIQSLTGDRGFIFRDDDEVESAHTNERGHMGGFYNPNQREVYS